MDLKGTLVFYALITWSGSSGYGLEGTLVFYALITWSGSSGYGLEGNTCVLCINNMERILWLWA